MVRNGHGGWNPARLAVVGCLLGLGAVPGQATGPEYAWAGAEGQIERVESRLEPPPPTLPSGDVLWGRTVSVRLQKPQWERKSTYDAGHFLMVPLHYAFGAEDDRKIQEFRDHFQRMVAAWTDNPMIFSSTLLGSTGAEKLMQLQQHQQDPKPTELTSLLNDVHYLYLASQFLALEQARNPEAGPGRLEQLLLALTEHIWTQRPVKGYTRGFACLRDLVAWRLDSPPGTRNYYRGIPDDQLFVMAIAGDLARVLDLRRAPRPPFLDAILGEAGRVFDHRERRAPDGWLFDAGAWSDHPEYVYAGHTVKREGLTPLPVEQIPWDTSHSHRFPLWLRSLRDAHAIGSPAWQAFDLSLVRLARQFVTRVMVTPATGHPYYRFNNYMDGSNGLYRWNTGSFQNRDNGYGPFELGNAFFFGWWGLLPAPQVHEAYVHLARSWPPPEAALKEYDGPRATPQATIAFLDLDSESMLTRQLIVRLLAARVERRPEPAAAPAEGGPGDAAPAEGGTGDPARAASGARPLPGPRPEPQAGPTAMTRSGKQAVRIWHKPATNSSISRYLGQFRRGETVTASAWVQVPPGTRGKLALSGTGLERYPGRSATAYAPPAGAWQRLTVALTLVRDQDVSLFLYGNTNEPAPDGTFTLYDDVEVRASGPHGVLLKDGFESGLGNWKDVEACADLVQASTPTGANGTGAVRVWHKAGSNSSLSRNLGSFVRGDTVTASAWVQVPPGTRGQLFLGNTGAPFAYDQATNVYTEASGGWQLLSITRTLTRDVDLRLALYGNTNANPGVEGTCTLYDEVRVTSSRRGTLLRDGFDHLDSAWSATGYPPDLVQ
jgi:hypothetical protein